MLMLLFSKYIFEYISRVMRFLEQNKPLLTEKSLRIPSPKKLTLSVVYFCLVISVRLEVRVR